MTSIIQEINKLRGGSPLTLDLSNNNRYSVVAVESDGSKTAYCFSTPIYNLKTRKSVDLLFNKEKDAIRAIGSNVEIDIVNSINMRNNGDVFSILLDSPVSWVSEKKLCCGADTLFPTTNGVLFSSGIQTGEKTITIKAPSPFIDVKANNKFFALMNEKFKPYLTVSCVGTADKNGKIIAPAILSHERISDRDYLIHISPYSSMGVSVVFEVNMYENKLIQDTTVESFNYKSNNVFGGTAFIGHSAAFGEQWLYTRLDFSRLVDLTSKKLQSIKLHIPTLNQSDIQIASFGISKRFCSFGTTWENKVSASGAVSSSCSNGQYYSLDMSNQLIHPKTRRLVQNDGFILKSFTRANQFAVISTGDSYFAPQIVEINYK